MCLHTKCGARAVLGPSIFRPRSLISFTSNRPGQIFGSSLLSIPGFSRSLSNGACMSSRRPYAALTRIPSSSVFASCRTRPIHSRLRGLAVLRRSDRHAARQRLASQVCLDLESRYAVRDRVLDLEHLLVAESVQHAVHECHRVFALFPTELHRYALVQQLGELQSQIAGFLDPPCRHLQCCVASLLDSRAGGDGLP